MIRLQTTDYYIKSCIKTWLLCEAIVQEESTGKTPRHDLITECSECARSCFAVVTRLVNNVSHPDSLVLDCLLHCRQCADECAKYPGEEDLQFCSVVSSICADTLKDIAAFQLN